MFSPYMVKGLKKKGCNEKVVKVIEGVLYENTLVNDDPIGYGTDVFVDVTMNLTSAGMAAKLGSEIGAAIGSAVPGAGTAVGIIVGAGIGAGIYFVTDVITINDKTVREDVKAGFDEGVEEIKSWF